MKKIRNIFIVLAVILSNLMCAVVGYQYAVMQRGIGDSAPAGIAFIYAVPYVAGIAVCAILAIRFHTK
ncbi:MAG: hypothetical protein E7446_07870 [Ruminococcaceae bacterium]|nr:hypothetical protein [Oscillospiraceae bacterium]